MLRASVAVLFDIGIVPDHGFENIRWHSPDPGWRRQHGAADLALPFEQDVDKALAVEGERQRPANIRVVKGRLVAIDDQVGADIGRPHFADCVGRLALDLLHKRYRHLVRKGQVEFAGIEGQQRRRAVRDDRVFDPVEMGPSLLPVIGVPRDCDPLVRLELGEFERAGPDRVSAHLARRHVTGIDRRIS